MQRTLVGFEASYRRHLAAEQRRAVLDALAQSFDDESTVGQIVDAAAALGYVGLGDLSLADLADALLSDVRAGHGATGERADRNASDDDAEEDDVEADADDDDDGADEAGDDEDEDEDEEESEVEAAPAAKARGRATAKPAAKAAAPKGKPAAPPSKAAAKPAGKVKALKISLDDRMSLAEAADVLLPLVRSLGQATMQQLEGSTAGAGRRKLRFHIGQLVRNGHLERHGMGRGTYYTVA
ncbi:MAG: hypothetical protein IAG13_19415 [Deltaproteobacteria bacterium]|nr:hypothetical protein [Nannocystaceae bacterium]